MLQQLLSPPYLPFAISFVVMLGIGLIEAVGLGLGTADLDGEVSSDVASHGFASTLLSWLGIGELPILI